MYTYGYAHVLRVCAPLYMWICFVANVYDDIHIYELAQGKSAELSDCVHLRIPIRTRTRQTSADPYVRPDVHASSCACMLMPMTTRIHACT